MRKVLKYSVSILLAFMYLLASVGIGVHECSSSGTTNVLIFYSDNTCESLHSHSTCACGSHDCQSKIDYKKCCKTEFHHLNSDYDVCQSNFHLHHFFLSLAACVCTSGSYGSDYLSDNSKYLNISYADHPPSIKYDTYSFHSQWRL